MGLGGGGVGVFHRRRFHGDKSQPVLERGRAVQVDPVKPTLKAPGTKRFTVKYEKLLTVSAFKFNLRRYSVVDAVRTGRQGPTLVHFSAQLERFVWDRGCA